MKRLCPMCVVLMALVACIALPACAGPEADGVSRVTAEPEVAAPSPLVLFADQVDDSGAYAMVVVAGDDNGDALVGRRLHAYSAVATRPPQAVSIAARVVAGDESGCTEPDRLQLAETDDPLPEAGALLSDVDINPGGRYSMSHASAANRAQVLDGLLAGLTDVPDSLRGALGNRGAVDVRIIGDARQPGTSLAVVSIDARVPPPANASPVDNRTVRWFALLERRADTGWRRALLERGEGCDDCDTLPDHSRLRAFGDFDQDGGLDLMIEDTHYESRSYRVLDGKDGSWTAGRDVGHYGC